MMRRRVRDWLFLRRVLREVNELRAQWGLEPIKRLPKGELGSASRCALGVALSGCDYKASVTGYDVKMYASSGQPVVCFPTSLTFRDFVCRFDRREFPHLIA